MSLFGSGHLADKIDVDDDEGLDKLFEELEEQNFDKYRELRIQEMKVQAEEMQKMKQNQHGEYSEVEEKDILNITTNTTYVVVHFYSPNFKRCKIIDNHLKTLSKKHYRTRFIKANAEQCPFLVAKLQIKVLPFVMCFVKGVVVERLVGFEQLGDDDFPTTRLEKVLIKSGVISKKENIERNKDDEEVFTRSIRNSTRPIESDEEGC